MKTAGKKVTVQVRHKWRKEDLGTRREYGHEFAYERPNVTGACIHCGVELKLVSESKDWDGLDQYMAWHFPDGTTRKFGSKTGTRKDGGKTVRDVGPPPCTVALEKDPAIAERFRKAREQRLAL